jgi:periplasmic protein TonB
MFESTLEAQALHDGERRFGTLSMAALAHLGIGLAIVTVTAFVVPKVNVPEPKFTVFTIASVIPPGAPTPRPAPAPPRGTDTPRSGRAVPSPVDPPKAPPEVTPATLPPLELHANSDGPDAPGEGIHGDPNGSRDGVIGGTGDVDGGGDGAGDGPGLNPLELTGDMVRPVLLEKVAPTYPQVARQTRLGGRVTVRAVIAPDGGVESVEVASSTNPLFNEAAVDAVRRWRYRPALMNGKPVRVYFTVVVDFVLR